MELIHHFRRSIFIIAMPAACCAARPPGPPASDWLARPPAKPTCAIAADGWPGGRGGLGRSPSNEMILSLLASPAAMPRSASRTLSLSIIGTLIRGQVAITQGR